MYAMDLPKRKPTRLRSYDYSTPGAYFVTVCTHEKKCSLSTISVGEGLAPPVVTLSKVGTCVEEQIRAIPGRYPTVRIDKYVIMPNHIHMIVTLGETAGGASPSPTLFDVVRVLKSLTTRLSRPLLGEQPLFQRSYHEHVIRNEADYRRIWDYIDTNPAKWTEDCYYVNGQ